MKVTNVAAGGSLVDYKFQRPTQGIGLVFNDTLANVIAGNKLENAKITVRRMLGEGEEKMIISPMSLKDAIEILGFKTGFCYEDNGNTVRTTIDLTFDGALSNDQSSYVSLTLENAPVAMDILAIGAPRLTNTNLQIQAYSANGTGTVRLGTSGAEALFIDPSKVTALRVIAGKGSYNLDKDSLQNVSMDFKPSVFMAGGAFKTEYNKLHMLLLNGIDAVDIDTNADTTVYFLKEKAY